MTSALETYFASLVSAAEAATGSALGGGTLVAPEADRRGSRSATSYPTPSGTIVWCDPALVENLVDMLDSAADSAIETDEFVARATSAGASLVGCGRNRVLDGELKSPAATMSDAGLSSRRLDRDDADDVVVLAAFGAAASDDDRDEADFDIDRLDPFIVGLFDGDQMVGYGSGLPAEIDERFDDIGVITHPGHRRRGLGALAVSEFVRHRHAADPERLMLYRCDVDNVGSNGIAESLGFTLAHTIGAVRFPE